MKQSDIAEAADMTQAYYSKIENGKIRSPEEKFVKGIAAAFSTTVADLCENLPLRGPEKKKRDETTSGLGSYFNTPRVIPLYRKSAKPKGFDFDDGVLVDDTDFTVPPPAIMNVPNSYAVVVPTDDMEPRFRKGDTVFVDPELAPYYGDDVVIKLYYELQTIMIIRQIANLEAVFDEDNEPIPQYGVLTAAEILNLEREMARSGDTQEEVWHPVDRLEMLSKNAKWFTLYPEYSDAPEEVLISEMDANDGHPFAINVEVIVASERHRYARAGSPLKRRSEVNPQEIGAFTGIPDDPEDVN